ncbi:MAG: hypothetical protein BGN95_23620 [Sphingomonas sp. 66-10]|uniref:hypothetical protein n=1 Tax=Sphingomonas sp. 66-10 TaxID=1895848 RepID=UPI00092C81AD|nr:hypothetical protein [Sphingomonas sp. 66-10]OJU20639.1 MAG: hypothetical protein BGN95_23620 [Sphingomonas sp. 66-10]
MNGLLDTKWLLATWQLQVALGSGYTAYMVAYTGVRAHHQAIDTTFRALAYGLVATAILLVLPVNRPLIVIPVAFVSTVFVGALWRRIGMRLWNWLLRWSELTWGDDTPSAWARMISDQDHFVTQIIVQTKDGRRLRCMDTRPFAGLPLGPAVLGTNGDIVLYVTHTLDGSGEREMKHTLDEHHGAMATYLPAGEIRQVMIRRKPRKTR